MTTAAVPTPASATRGSARGLPLWTMPATIRICLIRPIDAGSAGFFGSAPDFLTMMVRIPGRRAVPLPGGTACLLDMTSGRADRTELLRSRARWLPRPDPRTPLAGPTVRWGDGGPTAAGT